MAKVYVFLADGFEDVEALIPIDVLRRGGVEVVTVSTTEFPLVESAHGVNIEADIQFEQGDYEDADLLMLPGGMPGASNILPEYLTGAKRSEAASYLYGISKTYGR